MSDDFQSRVTAAMANPQHMGELPNADAIGTVGNADCGDMLRVWVKFKEEGGRKVIDRASFQSFGCETAIAAAMPLTRLKRDARAASRSRRRAALRAASRSLTITPTKRPVAVRASIMVW